MKNFRFLLYLFLLFCSWIASADEPEGYYKTAEQKGGQTLKEALFGIISQHRQLEYKELWTAYEKTDMDASGHIIDMYNDCDFEYQTDQCGSGSSGDLQNQCKCYNREHSMPKSWFNDGYPMYTDLYHLYPVSGYVNSRRSNYPFGEVGDARFTSTAGSKLGESDFPGYTGTVFEPVDEYKGDFARTYFYMATCYHNRIASWKSDMLAGNNEDDFTAWSKKMLLQWHKEDPVSEKEIQRNEAVYQIQGNRNPFIDHPEMVEKIWGNDYTPWGTQPDTTANQTLWPSACSLTQDNRFLQIEHSSGLMESVEVFDITGARLCATFERQSRFGYRLPCAGVYIVRITVGKRQYTRKLAVL